MKKASKIIIAILTLALTLSTLFSAFATEYSTYQYGEDNIVSQAATVYRPKDYQELTEMLAYYPCPNNIIFTVDAQGNVNGMDMKAEDIRTLLAGKAVPVFYLTDEESTDYIKNFTKENLYRDVMFCSKDAELVKAARNANKKAVGIIDFTDVTDASKENLNNMVYTANENLAKTVIISDKIATKEVVEYLQKRVITVWVEENVDTKAQLHGVIQTGANGIITDTPDDLASAYEFYSDDENVLVRNPFVIGHRGLPSQAPENTLESAIAAVEAGVDIVELDVRLTSDKEIVIYHNDNLEDITTGSGDTTKYSLEEIKKLTVLKSGEYEAFEKYTDCKIPTLREYFEEFKDNENVFFFVELKANSVELTELTCEFIEEYGMKDRVAILSFYQNLIPTVKKKLPGVSCGVFSAQVSGGDQATTAENFMSQYGAMNLTYHASLVSDANKIRALMYRGITTWPWTYRYGTTKEAYLLGVAGITTDEGDIVKDVPTKIEIGGEAERTVAPGSTLKYKPVVKTRVGEYTENEPELVIVSGKDIIEVEGNKIKTLSEGTAYLMYKVTANVNGAEGGDSTEMTIYSELIEITVDSSAKKVGCGGTIVSVLPVLLMAGSVILLKKKNEI